MFANVGDLLKRACPLALEAGAAAEARPFSDVACWTQGMAHCRILLVPSELDKFRAQAQTWTRLVKANVTWPFKGWWYQPEHWVFYDRRLPPTQAARLIGHELCHILLHKPHDPHRPVDRDTGYVAYTEKEEREADVFSLALLKHHSFRTRRKAPLSGGGLIRLLNRQAGWPAWLTKDEVRKIAEKL